jgi:ankyrin repeat protein
MFATALHAACYSNEQSTVELLLKKGADVHLIGGDFATPLQVVCASWPIMMPKEAVINLLVEKGVDVNTRGGKYGTALQAASYAGNQRLVCLLLQKGADVNDQCGEYGTALQAAIAEDLKAIKLLMIRGVVELLLEYGADVNTQGGKHGNALMAALHFTDDLHHAVDNQIVRQLFVHGADFGDLKLEHGLASGHEHRVAWITTNSQRCDLIAV